jgi:pteridine reductase
MSDSTQSTRPLESSRPLQGKIALVTGGGTRLGRAIAEGLARAGADIAVHFHRSAEGADSTLELIWSLGKQAQKFAADLTRSRDIESLVERVEDEMGPIGALVNSAAVFERASFFATTPELLQTHWELNARAPFLLSQEVGRRMMKRGQGDIVNVLDIGGVLIPWKNYAAYCMSKGALATLTRCLALELAPQIRVNAVAPGTILPPEGTPEETLEQLRARIPQHRFGTVEDVVESVAFLLAGPSFITGQILAVDGGRSLSSGYP